MDNIKAPGISREENKLIALIDADYIKYLVINDYKKNYINQVNKRDYLIRLTNDKVDDLLVQLNTKKYIFCFSGVSSNTFRNSIGLEKLYKGNRHGVLSYEDEIKDKEYIMEYIMKTYPSLLFTDLEADDIVSMLQDDKTFIVSRDKDLFQVPGIHWNFTTQSLINVTEDEANIFLFNQMLQGDSVDNVVGLFGYGPNKITQLFNEKNITQMFTVILKEYFKAHGFINGIDAFCENWMLLKTRTSRGTYFKEKYAPAFSLLNYLKNN